jgi:hypothetical protein
LNRWWFLGINGTKRLEEQPGTDEFCKEQAHMHTSFIWLRPGPRVPQSDSNYVYTDT